MDYNIPATMAKNRAVAYTCEWDDDGECGRPADYEIVAYEADGTPYHWWFCHECIAERNLDIHEVAKKLAESLDLYDVGVEELSA